MLQKIVVLVETMSKAERSTKKDLTRVQKSGIVVCNDFVTFRWENTI